MMPIPRFAVLGSPISHSLSPAIFRLFAEQAHYPLQYHRIEATPATLAEALKSLQLQGYQGVNLTSPLKELAFKLVHHATPHARLAKAVNMLTFNQDGSWEGNNTDGLGLVRDLVQNKQYTLNKRSILVLGAGGAVRGILPSLLDEKPQTIVVANRTQAKAAQLAEEFGVIYCDWEEISFPDFDFIIHGTAAGLIGQNLSLKLSKRPKAAICCYDLAYGQAHEPFLSWTKALGIKTCFNGLGMLIEQAAEAFNLWCGLKIETHTIDKQLSTIPDLQR
jgi:shikimate dehydrogenase